MRWGATLEGVVVTTWLPFTGCRCPADPALSPHVSAGSGPAWTARRASRLPVPGDLQLSAALQVRSRADGSQPGLPAVPSLCSVAECVFSLGLGGRGVLLALCRPVLCSRGCGPPAPPPSLTPCALGVVRSSWPGTVCLFDPVMLTVAPRPFASGPPGPESRGGAGSVLQGVLGMLRLACVGDRLVCSSA